MYVCDEIFSKYLENTASIGMSSLVVDSAGLFIKCKLNVSIRTVLNVSDFLSLKLLLKSPPNCYNLEIIIIINAQYADLIRLFKILLTSLYQTRRTKKCNYGKGNDSDIL